MLRFRLPENKTSFSERTPITKKIFWTGFQVRDGTDSIVRFYLLFKPAKVYMGGNKRVITFSLQVHRVLGETCTSLVFFVFSGDQFQNKLCHHARDGKMSKVRVLYFRKPHKFDRLCFFLQIAKQCLYPNLLS